VHRIPAGVQRDGVQGEVGVGDLLPGQLMVVAIFVDHHRPALRHRDTYQYKPVPGADLAEVAGHGVHHPKASGLLRQVLGAICEQVPAADSVVLLSAGELSQGAAVQVQLLEFLLCLHLCSFRLCWCDHSLLSDAYLGNQRLVTRELGGVPG